MSAGKLPEGWVQAVLGDYLFLKNGFAFKSTEYVSPEKHSFPVIRISDLNGTYASDSSAVHVLQEIDGFYIERGDLLIAMSGATTGKIGVYIGNTPAFQNQRVGNIKLHSSKYGNEKYRNYLISSKSKTILAEAYGGAQPNISGKSIESIKFYLAPLAEQKIIAEKLDTLLAQVDSTKARLEQIPQILKRFRQAVLTFAMNGELTKEWRSQNNNRAFFSAEKNSLKQFRNKELPSIPNNWSWMRFDQVADIASKLKSPLDYPNTIHLAPNHIESWTGKASGYQTILEDGVTSAKHEFYTGQIIYSKIRPYLCKVTIATFDGMCSADMYPINSKINTHFLFRWMLTSTFTDWASNAESRTVLPKINQKDLSEIPVPTPPLPEQHEIVRRVEQLFAYADTIEKQVNNALARVNNLTQSILAKAFSGELTAQWRAENPELISGENSAAALLEKIKAERAASGGKKASRKKS